MARKTSGAREVPPDAYAREFAALRDELTDFITRIPGVELRGPRPAPLRRGHRTVPMEFFRQLVNAAYSRPALTETTELDIDWLRAKLAYHHELSQLQLVAGNLIGAINGTLDRTKAEMTAVALPAYAVAKALAYRDPGAPDIRNLRRAMGRAGKAGRKKKTPAR